MASYHCTLKSDSNKSGSVHSDYINREGKYAAIENNRDKYAKYEDLVYKSSGNMPEWARENPKDFWKAADEFERANGRSYTEIEIALPNELTHEQQKELVEEFIKEQIGENHAYSYAIHDKPATLSPDKKNTHAHIMFSERELDGIERDREKYFKRGNSKNPERGGNMKDPDWNRRGKVEEVRRDWAELQNKHLERHGHEARVDHRSLEDQKIAAIERGDIEKAKELNREPERHLGPKVAEKLVREVKTEMANGQTKEEKIELRKQYYQKETTPEKGQQASLARTYRKDSEKLAQEKKAFEVEKIQQRLPIKNMKGEQALKYAQQAYWKKTEKAITKDRDKLDRDKENHNRVKAAVEIRLKKTQARDPLKPKNQQELANAEKELDRVTKWGEELKGKETALQQREADFTAQKTPPECQEEIQQTAKNILKKDQDRIEKLCELAEQASPGKKMSIEDLAYVTEIAIRTKNAERDILADEKAKIEKELITPEEIKRQATNIYTDGKAERLLQEKEQIETEKKLIKAGEIGSSPESRAALLQRIREWNEAATEMSERLKTPEATEKIKEYIAKLEEKNAPAREKLTKINEQLKPIERELRDLKGVEQKLKQAGRERDRKAQRVEKFISQIQRQVRRLTPRGVGRYAGQLNNSLGNLMADRGGAQAPHGSTQARIADDDDPLKKRGRGGLGD